MSDGAGTSAPPAGGAAKPLPAGATPPETRTMVQRMADAIVAPFTDAMGSLGEHMELLGNATRWLFRRPFRLRLFLDQMEFVGVGSLPIVMLVGFFSGAVAALQAIRALGIFNQERWAGATVGVSLAQELAPVFAGLMITARAGSGMATELGSMRITEQIDSLTTFAVNPVQYLLTPRIVASIVMLPVMTMVFNLVGLLGAYLVIVVLNGIDYGLATDLFAYMVDPSDYVTGIIKAAVFGLVFSLAACQQGFNVRGGAKEVGLATTRSVVIGSVVILVTDYFLTEILAVVFPLRA